MSESEDARRRYAVYAWMRRRGLWMSDRTQRRAEATSIRLDMATAERIVGRRTDAATLARREGVGW